MKIEEEKKIFATLEELEVDDGGCVLTFETIPDFSVESLEKKEPILTLDEENSIEKEIVTAEDFEAPLKEVVTAVGAVGEVPAPKYVNKNFAQKMMLADEVIQDRYDEVKNYALRFKRLKARISKKFESINQGRLQFVKLSVAGKTLKLYLNMDISEVDPKFRCKDMSDKVTYETVPTMLRIKSGRAVRYAKILIDQCAEKYGLAENKKFVEVDAMKVIEDFLRERQAKKLAKLGVSADIEDNEVDADDILEEIATAFEEVADEQFTTSLEGDIEKISQEPIAGNDLGETAEDDVTDDTSKQDVAEEITAVLSESVVEESDSDESTQIKQVEENYPTSDEKTEESSSRAVTAKKESEDYSLEVITPETIKKHLDDYFAERSDIKEYYADLEKLRTPSLQEVACQRDWIYLRKISTILHVIMSIIAHPHINNRREEIVTRIEQAKQLSNEDFTRVLQDGSLWKRYDVKMVPENVYYHQNVDELCIYENQFICLVVDMLSGELNEYTNFYVKMLPSMKNGLLNRLDGSKPQRILRYADLLKRRIIYIKNTRFYKEVSQAKPISRNIERTNILLKDILYSRVYRFYREYLSTEEKFITYDLLSDFIYSLILKDLSARGFKPTIGENLQAFENEDFAIAINRSDKDFTFEVSEKTTLKTAKHLLLLSLSAWFSDIEKAPSGFDTVEAMSEWARVNVSKRAEDFEEIFPEEQIVKDYLDDKLCLTEITSDVYERYCPVCREKNPLETNDVYYCPHCSSRYVFVKKGDNEAIWFTRLRRHR